MLLKTQNLLNIPKTSTIEAYLKKKDKNNTISATFFKNQTTIHQHQNRFIIHNIMLVVQEGCDGILGTGKLEKKAISKNYQSQDFEAVVDLKEIKRIIFI